MLVLATLFITHVLASDVVFLGLDRWLRPTERPGAKTLFVLTRGVGPLVISWLLYNLLLFAPGQPRALYVGIVLACLAVVFLVSRKSLSRLAGVYRALPKDLLQLGHPRPAATVLLGLLAVGCAFVLLVGVGLPIVGHDSLVLANDARLMHRDLSLERYLNSSVPDPQTGYQTINFQTPFLPTLYVWYGLIAGADQMDLLARTTSPIYALYCLAILIWAVRRRAAAPRDSAPDALLAALLLLSTPLFLWMAYDNAQDTPRYYLVFLALVWVARLISTGERNHGRLVAVVGMFIGFTLFSHLLGVGALLTAVLAVFLFGPYLWRARLATSVVIVLVALIAGSTYHYTQSPQIRRKLQKSFTLGFVKEWTQIARAIPEGIKSPPAAPSTPALAHAETPPIAKKQDDSQPEPHASAEATVTPSKDDEGPDVRAPPEPAPGVDKELPPRPTSKPAATKMGRRRSVGGLIGSRGQGDNPVSRFLFGRLQMFTGIESFGLLFWLSLPAIFLWWRRQRQKTILEKVLLLAAAVYTLVVLSGVRPASWSNPRYIGTLMIVVAYFAGPALGSWLRSLSNQPNRAKTGLACLVLGLLLFPAVLATSIRGAKLGITNTGSFYSDFRSFGWLEALRRDPGTALENFSRDHLGIRSTFAYFFADRADQLRHSHDYFGVLEYFNREAPPDAQALVFREGRYFYYAHRRGVPWYGTESRRVRKARTVEEAHSRLISIGVTHILTDSFVETWRLSGGFKRVLQLLGDPAYSELLYTYKSAKVYRLVVNGQGAHP